MSESEQKKKPNDFTQSATGLAIDLVKSVPLNDEAKNKAGDEIGKTLVTLTKAINVALTPVSLTIFGYEKIKDFVNITLKEKLKQVPKENIVPPKGNIVGPALDNLKYLEDTPDELLLKNMYANLIANSINKDTKDIIHPAFVDIIKQLDSNDVSLLEALKAQELIGFITLKEKGINFESGTVTHIKYLLNNKLNATVGYNIKNINSCLENLERLKIIIINHGDYFIDDTTYNEIRTEGTYKKFKLNLGENLVEEKSSIDITTFGKRFLEVCTD
ncbi:DUF4393 domain-containing protein [Providencia huaxiensis]|uniref:DUF4393 domain-containing protein n=1 Tax=Providencia TaxID=586 RepID=UPI0032DB2183